MRNILFSALLCLGLSACYESAVTRDDWTGSISSSANTASNSSSVGGNSSTSSSSSIVNGVSSSSATNSSSSVSTNSSSVAVPELIALAPDPASNSLPTLNWKNLGGATQYTIQIASDLAFTHIIEQKTVAGTNFTPSFNLPLGTIFWRVRSDLNASAWSAPDQFEISCGAKLGDSRDKQLYNTIQIGTQCWMAQNLNYAKSTGEPGNSWCYDNNTSNCTTYGRLYDWNAVMAGASSSDAVPSGVRGICPSGWHVPSDGEWSLLVNSCGGYQQSSNCLISKSGWNSTSGSDNFGFTALPSGYVANNSFSHIGLIADFRTSSAESHGIELEKSDIAIYFFTSIDKTYGYSLRCLKD